MQRKQRQVWYHMWWDGHRQGVSHNLSPSDSALLSYSASHQQQAESTAVLPVAIQPLSKTQGTLPVEKMLELSFLLPPHT